MYKLYIGDKCGKCHEIMGLLTEKKIPFQTKIDVDFLLSKGFRGVPVLQVEDKFMSYGEIRVFLSTK